MKDVLKDAKSDASGKEMVQKSLATAEHQVKKATKCKQDNGVDCDDVAPGAGVDQSKLDYCMELSDSDTVRTNIRKAFEVGNLRTGCALLSLATNSVLKSIHDCMCGGGGSGGGGGGDGVFSQTLLSNLTLLLLNFFLSLVLGSFTYPVCFSQLLCLC